MNIAGFAMCAERLLSMKNLDAKRTGSSFFLERDRVWDYALVPASRFCSPLDADTAERVCMLYQEHVGGTLFNGPTVCLEGIGEGEGSRGLVELSIGTFYDFLLCNIVGRDACANGGKLVRELAAAGADSIALKGMEELAKGFGSERKRIRSFEDAMKSSLLPGAIAVSVLVKDPDGRCLLSKRTGNVIIGKMLGGVTATGTVEPADLTHVSEARSDFADPFSACAARELSEETSLAFAPEAYRFRGLFIGKAKLQPIAIVDVECDRPIFDAPDLRGRDGGDEETYKLAPVAAKGLSRAVKNNAMTEASAFHIGLHVPGGEEETR